MTHPYIVDGQIFHCFPLFPPCSHMRVISTVFHFFHPVHMYVWFSLQGGEFVERHVYGGKCGKCGKSEKTKTKGVNSKNMFSVACHVGKLLYLRSL